MKPDAPLKPDLTLEHVLAAAIARRVTDGTFAAPTCRVMAYESGGLPSRHLDSRSIPRREGGVRALPGDLA